MTFRRKPGEGYNRFPGGRLEAEARETRRELIDLCRRRAVREMRDGREFVVVHLPDTYPESEAKEDSA